MTKDLWNIEKEFERMRRQMDHLMNGFFSDSFERDAPLLGSSNKNKLLDTSFKTPATDIYETDKEVVAKIDVPGVKKEDIKLEVKNGMLSLKAEHKLEKEDKNEKKGFHRIERSYRGFARSFSLPAQVDETKVKAEYKNGILEVHMPKKGDKDKAGVKYIDIN
ncbi:MAG: Hsp20/alpha crystallin family protein [Nanoarchaeota archaeon]|nr:Hsp20/alpha crystallin family protein [Nanoarchaeota archaeon]